MRDVAALAAAVAVVGASFGALAVAAGVPVWLAMAMSLLVFAGGSQFMVVGVIAAGGTPFAAVTAALLLNLRHLPFGLVVGEVLGRNRAAQLLGAHIMIDESVAFAMAQRDPDRARAAYWACGIALFCAWNPAVLIGAYLGEAMGDPALFGLDAAFPAALFALLLPQLREPGPLRVAVGGAVLALVATPFLPAGVPVLVALLGVALALPLPRLEKAR
ncbi:AzlC family ABC transporter permease [Allokutzneria oryzae]|uniref:AzlC family ABC transporter permease n=1 Tax=Allokutzneria oryzae TaxID=1378989 RepID=A0ABV5ZPV1_9PSEU